MTKIESSLTRRRSGLAGAAAFFCTVLLILPTLAQAQPPKWDVSIFRSINDSRSVFMDGAVGTNDNLVLPIAIATPIVFAGVGLAKDDAYTFDTGAIVGFTEALAYVVYYPIKNFIVKRERPYVALTGVHTGHLDSAD